MLPIELSWTAEKRIMFVLFPLLCKEKHEENTSLLILSDTKAQAGLSIFKATATISMYHSMAAPL